MTSTNAQGSARKEGDAANEALTSAICPWCEHRVRIIAPRGGDGSARVFTRHGTVGARCRGSRSAANV